MSVAEYEPVIGLEIHCQLQTRSKLFSAVNASFSDAPNRNVDALVLGHPGTLPVPNRKAIEYVVKMGLGTGCSIRPVSYFARKHYFYPDLPKGYQISQYEDPICFDGKVELPATSVEAAFSVGITRIHLEEDAGKSIHDRSDSRTLLDYNRAGIPLAELVTEPDIRSPRQAYLFMRYMRQLVRYLGVCDGNMQEGSLRCDANVSVRKVGTAAFGTKTEIKNMNSFRHVEAALEFEIERQKSVLGNGGHIVQETLLWDVDKQVTRTMRSKEDSHDYRYFRDPDLPAICVPDEKLSEIRSSIPELPIAKKRRYMDAYLLSEYDAGVLTDEREIATYFEDVVDALSNGPTASNAIIKHAANFVMSDVLRLLSERSVDMASFPINPTQLAGLVELRANNEVSSSAAQKLIEIMIDSDESAASLADEHNLISVSSVDSLLPVVQKVLSENPKQVADYRSGKTGLIGYFIGQVMREFAGSPDPAQVRMLLTKELGDE